MSVRYHLHVAQPQGPFYMALGSNIANARRKARVTQAALSQAVGLSRTSITNIERGRQPLQIHLLLRIAEALETELTMLLPGRSSVAEKSVASQLTKLRPETQAWVRRVITTISPGDQYAGEESASEKKSARVTRKRKEKGTADSD